MSGLCNRLVLIFIDVAVEAVRRPASTTAVKHMQGATTVQSYARHLHINLTTDRLLSSLHL